MAKITEETIVRKNLMTQENYSPYCGSDKCFLRNPRAKWDNYKYQFTCRCGWTSQFPSDFIERYVCVGENKMKWTLNRMQEAFKNGGQL